MRKTILRRTASVALAGVMAMGMLAGCGNNASTTEAPTDNETQAQETSAETERLRRQRPETKKVRHQLRQSVQQWNGSRLRKM